MGATDETYELTVELQQELDALQQEIMAHLPTEVAKTLRYASEELVRSGIAAASLREGDRAPAFTLPDVVGRPVSLDSLLAQGPVVLTFYRGSW